MQTEGRMVVGQTNISGQSNNEASAIVNPHRPLVTPRECGEPRDAIEAQLIEWIKCTTRSNHELLIALECLRESYAQLLASHHVKSADAVLRQADLALANAFREDIVIDKTEKCEEQRMADGGAKQSGAAPLRP